MKVLIIEDDAINRKLIEVLMKPIATTSDLAKDGEEALNFFTASVKNEDFYDLVLLDIMLPKLDGQTLLRKFREMEKESGLLGRKASRIIMITALGDAGNIMEAFKNQADGYLSKPYNQTKLMKELRKLELID